MRKFILSAAITALLVSLLSFPALARGHRAKQAPRTYSLCQYESCNTVGTHWHDGTAYSGHHSGDGHDYHQLCGVANCPYLDGHDEYGYGCYGYGRGSGGCCGGGYYR